MKRLGTGTGYLSKFIIKMLFAVSGLSLEYSANKWGFSLSRIINIELDWRRIRPDNTRSAAMHSSTAHEANYRLNICNYKIQTTNLYKLFVVAS